MQITLLDCTLREAPIDNLYIGTNNIQKFINELENAGVNIIECGFLKNSDYNEGSCIFNKVEEIAPYLKEKKNNIIYTALVDYGRYDLKYLSDFDGKSIDAIRICFKKGEQNQAIEYARQIKDKGYKVFIQHVDTIGYSEEEIIEIIDKVNELKPYAYAIVDTFGSMYFDDVERIYKLVDKHLDRNIILGFHGHNNLMLANSNSEFFISIAKDRNINVDSSVLGCGRSAGNAHTELLMEYLNKKWGANYNLNIILNLIDNMMPYFQDKCTWGYSIPYFITGIHTAHTFNAKYLIKKDSMTSNRLYSIISELDPVSKKMYNYELLDNLYDKCINRDYSTILFDLDGTLLNTTEGVIDAVKRTILELNLAMPAPDTLSKFVGPPMQESFEKYFYFDKEKALKAANLFRQNYKVHSLYKAELYPGVLALLRELKELNKKIAIATNKSHNNAVSIINHFGLDKYCDFVLGSDLEGKLTKTDIIKQCLNHLNSNANEAVLVGDSEYDYTGANTAGISFIPVSYGFGFRNKGCQNVEELSMLLMGKVKIC